MSKHHILLYLKHTVLFRVPFLSAKQQMLEDKRLYSSQHSTGSTLKKKKTTTTTMITPNIIIYSLCFIRLRYYKENFEADHSRVPLMN